MIKMKHYWWKQGNKIVVQNAVGGYLGQQHTHTEKSFIKWVNKNNIDPNDLVPIGEAPPHIFKAI